MSELFKKRVPDDHSHYRLNVHKALVAVLFIFHIVVFLSPKISVKPAEVENVPLTITVADIPATSQAHRSPPPPKPAVPVPSDDESIPEDETIAETALNSTNFFDDTDGASAPAMSLTPARAIAWVFPEYPEDERKRGVHGVVRLSLHIDSRGKVIDVVIVENTTESEECARAATAAAYGSRFTPAKEGGKPVNSWISQPYRFDIKE